MKLLVNGEETTLEKTLTIGQLLLEQQIKMPEMVSVELNGNILDRGDFETTTLNEDDQVEFLYFMGGGGQ